MAVDSFTASNDEDWKIACHEAGHAIVALVYKIPINKAAVGPNEYGEVEPAHNPLDDPDNDYSPQEIRHYLQFSAAGAAAERVVFGQERDYANKCDRLVHARLEALLPAVRRNGFEEDVQSAMKLLVAEQVQLVAKELMGSKQLDTEAICRVLGCKVPWE